MAETTNRAHPVPVNRRTTGAHRRNRLLALLICFLAAIPLVGPNRALALVVTFDADADAWIDQGAQTVNHGADQTIQVKARATSKRRTLVRFDLSDLPACATVSEARLRLHADSNSLSTSVSHRVHLMIADWDEDGVTWLTRNGTNPWLGGGGASAGDDFAPDGTAIAATGTGTGFVEWDVTPDVQAILGGADNFGWIVKHAVEGGGDTNVNNTIIEYASREAAANRPELVVTLEYVDVNCDDANECTDDACTASGCENTNNTNPCDDGDACTDGDACSEGSCASGPPLNCNDGIDCTADSCDSQIGCVNTADSGICDDGNLCTFDVCVPGEGCVNDATPLSGCRTAAKSVLLIKDSGNDAKDKLIWKFSKGEATSQAEFGSPRTTTDYALCIYAGPDEEYVMGITVPSHGSHWKALGSKGFKYKDKGGTADGVQGLLVKGSQSDKSRAIVKAKDQSMPDAALGDLPAPLVAQLLTSDTSVCWEAAFSTIRKNSARKLQAKK